ncbi:DUF4232 domain-containing protein [Nocardia sp. NEAU-G5]|uniref:DUF4232 domain-containing protein n=1 Tax=Nocardia albiluteola TaxID=2842303 RepID=A0ABS6B7I0_9NOCA|nr:DUF4232 domain-containing protein [Nocardia albiluteola]MBU3066274.1 DUF4232 domain-containing protein [Nocardia albiluteola]
MTALKTTAVALLAVGTLTLAGCASESSGPTPSPVITSATPGTSTGATTPAPTTTESTSTPVGPALCRTADLRLSTGRSDGAAGHAYTPLIFVNAGTAPCTLTGFPGVSFADSPSGDPIGAPADRDTPKPTVTLEVNGTASAVLRITAAGNYGDRCHQITTAGLRIYPPDNTDSLYLPWHGSACANPDVHLLRIASVVAGVAGN